MPPIGVIVPQLPRIVVYHQTHFHNGQHVSVLPLHYEKTGATHVIIAAIHLNSPAGNITLNDDPYSAPKNDIIWSEVKTLQAAGIKVLGMLGGAARGSFARLDGSNAQFEAFYEPLKVMVAWAGFDGLDLDVEEEMSLAGIVRLIDRLKTDFGAHFLITLAPVATALQGRPHLSGFSYSDLEKAMGRHIAWYNTQFYCGWGDAETTEGYDVIVAGGWDPSKVVMGLVTNPANGAGYVFEELQLCTLDILLERYGVFGGVMGWEYFNSVTDAAQGKPWLWAHGMAKVLKRRQISSEQATTSHS